MKQKQLWKKRLERGVVGKEEQIKMALRKASAYTKHYTRPYTRRSSVRSKSYIKTIPPQKIVRFNMGNFRWGDFLFTSTK